MFLVINREKITEVFIINILNGRCQLSTGLKVSVTPHTISITFTKEKRKYFKIFPKILLKPSLMRYFPAGAERLWWCWWKAQLAGQ